jgi:hypothetical protein
MASCREVKGREFVRERERDQINSMKIEGHVSTGGVTLFHMMSKRKKEKD